LEILGGIYFCLPFLLHSLVHCWHHNFPIAHQIGESKMKKKNDLEEFFLDLLLVLAVMLITFILVGANILH